MPPTLIGVIHTDDTAHAVDLGDQRQRTVDREALADAEGGARKAAGPEGERLQILDERVVSGIGVAEGRGTPSWAAARRCLAREAEGLIM